MDTIQSVASRYSVRAYRADPISDDTLHKVLEAARLAPTADNRQPFRLIVIRTEGRKQELTRVYARRWFVQAPIVVAVVAVPSEAWRRVDGKSYHEVDAAIAMDHLVLAATSLGLGTCWVADVDPAVAREVLGLPDEAEFIAFTPLGYAARQPSRKKRRRLLEDLVRYEHW